MFSLRESLFRGQMISGILHEVYHEYLANIFFVFLVFAEVLVFYDYTEIENEQINKEKHKGERRGTKMKIPKYHCLMMCHGVTSEPE